LNDNIILGHVMGDDDSECTRRTNTRNQNY
jgi:hypothetical protein